MCYTEILPFDLLRTSNGKVRAPARTLELPSPAGAASALARLPIRHQAIPFRPLGRRNHRARAVRADVRPMASPFFLGIPIEVIRREATPIAVLADEFLQVRRRTECCCVLLEFRSALAN